MKFGDHYFLPFRLEALTPVHIGSGEDFSPLAYVIRQNRESGYEIKLLDTASWLAANYDNPEIAKALDAGDMAALRRLLNASDTAAYVLASIPVKSQALGRELERKRNSVDNRAEIMAFTRDPFTRAPYAPGSSLKGAMTTAVADWLDAKRKGKFQTLRETRMKRDYVNVMKEMFGSAQYHAMRNLALADVPLPPNSTSVRAAIGVNLKPGKTLSKTPCETLDPATSGSLAPYGNMRFKGATLVFPGGARISLQEFGVICTEFYKKRYFAELKKFYTLPHFSKTGKFLEPVSEKIKNCDGEKRILLRIGRYSHIECVTVSGEPPRMKRGCGTTRTLADSAAPFGWVILDFCSPEEYEKGRAELGSVASRAPKNAPSDDDQGERQKKEARAEALEAKLATMTPLEKNLWLLAQENATENLASELYKNLETYGEEKGKVAEALMTYWQRIGKWQGKSLSKRQKEKVAAVMAILDLGRES